MNDMREVHRLVRITLIDWYLFRCQDIVIEADSILFRGSNGAGKSSLIDAIQTVLAGGDENALSMNSASSEVKGSGRTLKSYSLGMVSEGGNQSQCPPRKIANTYICLSFKSHTGETYAIGISLFARDSDSKVQKNRFIIQGQDLSSTDFMTGPHQVLPWRDFERRLRSMSGRVSFHSTASEFRLKFSDVMSAPGRNRQISPERMWKAIKNGISFKEQKSIVEFTRTHILPDDPIDVRRIESDYSEYKRIQTTIERAREQLESLQKVVRPLRRHISRSILTAAYNWCTQEAAVFNADIKLEQKKDQRDILEKQLQQLNAQNVQLNKQRIDLQKFRDEAFEQLSESGYLAAKKELENEQNSANEIILKVAIDIRKAITAINNLIQLQSPQQIGVRLEQDFLQAQNLLRKTAKLDQIDLVSDIWPESLDQIIQISQTLDKFSAFSTQLQDERDFFKAGFDAIKQHYEHLNEAVELLDKGEAALMKETQTVIELLYANGITATAVCDLCQVTNADWQIGIERFLGSNREALVIEPENYTQALAIYREAKNKNPQLRQVKLINPDKGFGYEGVPKSGTAAELVDSENIYALKFLRGLLQHVRLVDTEEQLRHEHRAITRDGMVAGNGAISGGNRFSYVLIGIEARKAQARAMMQELDDAKRQYNIQLGLLHSFDTFNRSLPLSLRSAIEKVEELPEIMHQSKLAWERIEKALAREKNLTNDANIVLQETFEQAETALNEHHKTINELATTLGVSEHKIKDVINSIPILEKVLTDCTEQRKKTEKDNNYSAEKCAECWDILSRQYGENYENIEIQAAQKASQAAKDSDSAYHEGKNALYTYRSKFEPIDGKELVELPPPAALERCEKHIERIEGTELLRYEDEARETRERMLTNFRGEVVAKLKSCFQNVEHTFSTLNKQLKELSFNNNRYRFVYPKVSIELMATVHDYVTDTSDLDIQNIGSLFDETKDHPAVELIQNVLIEGRLSEIADYRNFYTYDIVSKDLVSGVERNFSDLLNHGSGGEQQAPFYVALGASFMNAYNITKVGDRVQGGVGLAIFDEAFSKMDGNNARAALAFFQDIGLQVILAAPPEAEVKMGAYVKRVYNVLRRGSQVSLDYRTYTPRGRELIESDNPHLHQELIDAMIPEVKANFGVEMKTVE
jgi:uncharacterized protein YPO0396